MANTLTDLIPIIYKSYDTVLREQIGAITAVTLDASAAMSAKDQVVRSFVTPQGAITDITPGATPADSGGQAFSYVDVTVSKSKKYEILWNGEEQTGDPSWEAKVQDQFRQAFRTLANAVELDVVAQMTASRAYGLAGTTPFGTAGDLSDLTQARKILIDNGMNGEKHAVLNTSAGANLRGKMSNLFKANEAGSTELLSTGNLPIVEGVMLHESGQIASHTKGTGTLYTTSAAGFAVGTTSIPLITGSGTILAGDVITIAGDTNKYVVKTGISAPGTVVIEAPGLRQAVPASAEDVTVGNSFTPNFLLDKSAIVLLARQPVMPVGGDSASDVISVTDEVSGLTMQVAMYKMYRQTKIEVGLAWGTKVVKPQGISLILG